MAASAADIQMEIKASYETRTSVRVAGLRDDMEFSGFGVEFGRSGLPLLVEFKKEAAVGAANFRLADLPDALGINFENDGIVWMPIGDDPEFGFGDAALKDRPGLNWQVGLSVAWPR